MKFNAYAALLMTGALMIITVVVAQSGSNAALLRKGVASVDRDVSTFAAKTLTSLGERVKDDEDERVSRTRVAALDKQTRESHN